MSAESDSSLPRPKSAYTAKIGARAGAFVKVYTADAPSLDLTEYEYDVAGARPVKSAVQNCAR